MINPHFVAKHMRAYRGTADPCNPLLSPIHADLRGLPALLIQVGSKVTIQEEGSSPEMYTIVGAAEANPRLGRVSNESPLGKSLLSHKIGDRVQIDAPAGVFAVTIIKVE